MHTTIHPIHYLLVSLLWLIYPIITPAEVVLDGTLGPAISLEGPNFNITAELGQQYGGNLFHSFELFNLNKGQQASFSGPDTVENIISRVTGGLSKIDGKLQSKIPNANLYLLNPDGFIFGPNANLDLQGALHISTATQLNLGDSGTFYTRHPERSVLVSAPPSAFGFLDTKPALIKITDSQLATPEGQTMSILGGNINIDGGHLRAISGRINLAAIANAKQLKSTTTGLELDANAQLSQIVLKNNASVDVGKQGAGYIYIRGGQFFIDNSNIMANTEHDKDIGLIAIDVNELHINAANIDSRAFGPGEGGEITIKVAGNATLSDGSQIRTSSLSSSDEAGDAGNISLQVQGLELFNSSISTTTYGPGLGGDITIEANHHLQLIGSTDFPSAIQARSKPKKANAAAGDAGHIFIRAGDLSLTGAASIDNSTFGAGQGGSITLDIIDQLHINDNGLISADSFDLGNAGSIHINTTLLGMDGGTISTAAEQADGGNIIVNARSWLNMNNSLISATVSGGQGNGGNVAISNPCSFSLTNSQVIANANAGNGGRILIITGTPIKLDNSSITASSKTGLEGNVKIDDIYNMNINPLPIGFIDASILIKQRCAVRRGLIQNIAVFSLLGVAACPMRRMIYRLISQIICRNN